MEPLLSLWTVYDHPLDMPHVFVARRFEIRSGSTEPSRTDDVRQAVTLEELRAQFRAEGLFCMARHPFDDPFIVETWL